MVSKAIASLDAWLARAEEVLAEQREHSISPSEGAAWDRSQEQTVISLATLAAGLEEVLSALCARPGRWILIVEHNLQRQLFWQALAFEDGSLCTEVVSNHYLDGEDRWTPEQEVRLLALGWDPPNPPKRPNWIHVEATTSPDTATEGRRALATLRDLFGLGDDNEVLVKMFSSTLRGDTPASPVYETDITKRERNQLTQVHYLRPDVENSDDDLLATAETWLDAILGKVESGDEREPVE
jgi:hypothetical protein